ncbi:MAG: YcaO-like family protein [Oligoflexia bacterium]|nr:YcaO-like family protein [Oligoflexia bacterium]
MSKELIDILQNVELSRIEDKIIPEAFHYIIREKKYGLVGSGSSLNEYLALEKSKSEIIERFFCNNEKMKNRKINSNGMAAHKNIELAKRSALLELVERDLFLTSWLSGHHPYWENSINESSTVNNIKSRLSKIVDVKLGHISNYDGYDVCVGVVLDREKKFGAVFSTAIGESKKICYLKILIELSRVVNLLNISIEKNEKIINKGTTYTTPLDHFNHYLNPGNCDEVYEYLSRSEDVLLAPKYHFHFYKYELPDLISKNISVVRCSSDEVQNYYVSEFKEINLNRIKDIKRSVIHPLG